MASRSAPAIVHLPSSLVALFPNAPRRLEATGATVAEVLDDVDRQVPGIRNRLLDAGPEIRAHINVYVSAERAGLDTEVPPGAAIHIVPAVSGG
ncbi:MAG TPA: MoaD/ThiS family protein [Candidatus Limnocylindrales bacterium]